MNEQQQRRVAGLILQWNQVDGRTPSDKQLAALRQRIVTLRLDAALADLMRLTVGTDCEIIQIGSSGPKEGSPSQFSFGLRLIGCDFTSDGEQWIGFRIDDDGAVVVTRGVVTRRRDGDDSYTPPVEEGRASMEEATIEWFTDRFLDFLAAKVANPRPSGLPLSTPTKAPEGQARRRLAPQALLVSQW